MPLRAFSALTITFLLCSLKSATSEEYHIVAPDSLMGSGFTLSKFVADVLPDYQHSNATLRLDIQPGLYILSHSLDVSDVDTFSIVSNDSTSQIIICDNQSAIHFVGCKDVHITNIEFIGCENSKVHDTERFLLEDVVFRDSEYGTGLEITNTTAQFIHTIFASNRGGTLQKVPAPEEFQYLYGFKMAGSAIIAKSSNINISECVFKGNEAQIGGALYVENSIITIQGTNFSANHVMCGLEVDHSWTSNYTSQFEMVYYFCSGYLGGALTTYQSDVTIEGTTFYNNSAFEGGVIYFHESNITIKICDFFGNLAEGNGGVFKSTSSNIMITGSSFQNNSASGFGGVMHSYKDTVLLENNTFKDSYSSQRGGILFVINSDINISSCSFIANYANNIGGVLDASESSVSMTFCLTRLTIVVEYSTDREATSLSGIAPLMETQQE